MRPLRKEAGRRLGPSDARRRRWRRPKPVAGSPGGAGQSVVSANNKDLVFGLSSIEADAAMEALDRVRERSLPQHLSLR